MVRAGKYFLNLVQVSAYAGIRGILLCVDRAALQCEVNLGPCKRCRLGSDSCPECHMVAVVHRTNLKSLEIRKRIQFFVGCCQTVCSVLKNAEVVETCSIKS